MFSRQSDFGELFNNFLSHKELDNTDYNENFFVAMNQISFDVFVILGF